MELKEAILQRRSIRGFTAQPIARETLCDVLQLATRAISSENAQPWELTVVTGEVLNRLRRINVDCLLEGAQPDLAFQPLEGVYRKREISVAKQLFEAMEIARGDREKRDWWSKRGYRFFDAPVGILVSMDQSLEQEGFRFDLGCLAQNICLAALEYGLGTCVAIQPVTYQKEMRELLQIPDSKQIVCGIAIGYPDWEFPANHVVSTRAELAEVVTWYGFSD